MRLSPSQLEQFDPTSVFGCQRKWWWKYVQKVPSPADESQQLGIDVHKSIEDYIKGDGTNRLHPIAMNGKQWIDEARGHQGKYKAEFDISIQLFGHEFIGKVDYQNDAPRLLDWKTTSNVKKYAKKPEELPTYIPLIIYAKKFFEEHPEHDELDVGLVYLQTKGKTGELRQTRFTRKGVDAELPRLELLVRSMETVAQKTTVEDVEGCFEKCNVGRGCPYNNLCHGDVMSLFDRFSAPKKTEVEVLPPDAPKSHPVLAAESVKEKVAPVVPPPTQVAPAPQATTTAQPKRGPGRPRKAVSEPVEEHAVTQHRVSVRHSLTINLGNYESAKVEVELEGDDGFENVNERVVFALSQATRPYQAMKEERLSKGKS